MNIDAARLDCLLDEAGLDAMILLDPTSVEYATGHRAWVTREMREYMVDPSGGFDLVWPPMAILGRGGVSLVVAPAWFAADEAGIDLAGAYLYQTPAYALQPGVLRGQPETDWHRRLSGLVDGSRRHDGPLAALAASVRAVGVDLSRVGMEALAAPARLVHAIHCELGVATRMPEVTGLVRRLRAVKSADEIGLLRQAALIAEDVGIEVLRAVASGLPLNNAVRDYRRGISQRNAEVEHFMFSEFGLAFSTARGPTRVVENEAVAVDWGCRWDGYRSDTGHTVVVGQVDNLVWELHAALAECVEFGASLLRPGVDPEQVSIEMGALLEGRGIHNANPHGHGIGLDVRDLPIAMRATPEDRDRPAGDLRSPELENNMVVNLEATLLLPPVGAVEVERTFVVAPDGGVPLVDQPRAIPVAI